MAVNFSAYEKIQQQLDAKKVTLVAVSKTKTKEDIITLYNNGQKDFGENYVQELADKYEALPKDIQWHFIGHLQTNKVKYILPFIHLIHTVDSERLLQEINKQAAKMNRIIPCLVQVYISNDETKFGFDEAELEAFFGKIVKNKELFKNVHIKGLMGMATFTDDHDRIKAEFGFLKSVYDKCNELYNVAFTTLSMGMSADYAFAVDAGSTMVRIGSLLFGERNSRV